jgi:hypothetical protein
MGSRENFNILISNIGGNYAVEPKNGEIREFFLQRPNNFLEKFFALGGINCNYSFFLRAETFLRSAVPPLMVKTAGNPEGLPKEVFNGLQPGRPAQHRRRWAVLTFRRQLAEPAGGFDPVVVVVARPKGLFGRNAAAPRTAGRRRVGRRGPPIGAGADRLRRFFRRGPWPIEPGRGESSPRDACR